MLTPGGSIRKVFGSFVRLTLSFRLEIGSVLENHLGSLLILLCRILIFTTEV